MTKKRGGKKIPRGHDGRHPYEIRLSGGEHFTLLEDEVTVIDLADTGTLRAAMIYLAALAYPEDHANRDRFIRALRAKRVRMSNEAGGLHLSPGMDKQPQEGTLRRGFARVLARVQMAEVFAPVYSSEVSAQLLPDSELRIRGGGSPTHWLKKLAGDKDHSAIFQEKWKPTLPVLHLAMSLRAHLMALQRTPGNVSHPMQLLTQPDWVEGALRNAEGHADTLQRLERWESLQVRLRLKC